MAKKAVKTKTAAEVASKGGAARAKALSPEERSQIARAAVKARWAKANGTGTTAVIPRATHAGEVKIGDIAIPCYVLEDGTRLISHRGLQKSLGLVVSGGAQNTAKFVGGVESKVASDNNLTARISEPIEFIPPNFGRSAFGYEATVLADICELILSARQAGVVSGPRMDRIATQCEILVRGFARVGIIALVDEATGYQEDRGRKELQKILEKYISKELARWVKTFPNEFYEEMYRLRSWKYDSTTTKRPGCVAYFTIDLTYDRLAPDLVSELKERTPRNEKGRLKNKLFQWLSTGYGHPRLRQQLEGVMVLMKVSRSWDEFYYRLNQIYPKLNQTAMLPIPAEEVFPPDEIQPAPADSMIS